MAGFVCLFRRAGNSVAARFSSVEPGRNNHQESAMIIERLNQLNALT
jgi:hypothetical protein